MGITTTEMAPVETPTHYLDGLDGDEAVRAGRHGQTVFLHQRNVVLVVDLELEAGAGVRTAHVLILLNVQLQPQAALRACQQTSAVRTCTRTAQCSAPAAGRPQSLSADNN